MRTKSTRNLILAAAAAMFGWPAIAPASTVYWDGNGSGTVGGGTGSWNTTNHRWSDAPDGSSYAAWTNGDTASFGASAGIVSMNITLPSAGGLEFTVTGYVIQNSTLNMTTGSIDVQGLASDTATITAVLAISGNTITKIGPGRLVLGGTSSNTVSSGAVFTVAEGQVDFNKDADATAFGPTTGAATLNVGDGTGSVGSAVVKLTGNSADQITDKTNLSIAADGTLDLNGKTETVYNVNAMSGGSITSAGAPGGVLVFNASTGSTLTATGSATISAGLELTTTSARTRIFKVTNADDSLAITGPITEAAGEMGSLTKSGAGLLTLSGSNSYTGLTIVTDGTLAINADVALGGNAAVRIGSGSNTPTLRLTAPVSSSKIISLNGTDGSTVETIDTGGVAGDSIWTGGVTGTGTLTKKGTGAGRLFVNGTSSWVGGLTVAEGSFGVSSGTMTPSAAAVVTIGADLTIAGAGAAIAAPSLYLAGSSPLNPDPIDSGNPAAKASLTVADGGRLNLTGVAESVAFGQSIIDLQLGGEIDAALGNLTVFAGSLTRWELDGDASDYGRVRLLAIGSDQAAAWNGGLDFSLIGAAPDLPLTYDLLTAPHITADPATIAGGQADAALLFPGRAVALAILPDDGSGLETLRLSVSQAPEPATLTLLLGGVLLIPSRRRAGHSI
jgi:autotransporter-associated beta strand protein